LTKELLFSQRDELAIEKVQLTRGHVFVREMTAKEKNTWERALMKKVPQIGGKRGNQPEWETTLEDYRAKLAACTICDAEGELLFTMRDVKDLGEKLSAANMEKIVDVANRLNAITLEDQEALVKNSEADQNDSSSSGSAEN
jgi:hypothetical protein